MNFENDNYLLTEAIQFATYWHREGLRKGTDMPYIVHPLEVMHNLYLMGADKKLIAAGVLHDVVEDTPVTIQMIQEIFGKEVAMLVDSHTEHNKELPWEERKCIALTELACSPQRVQMLVLADKLANIRAMNRDYKVVGVDLWKRFNRGKDKQAWYYHRGAHALGKLANNEATAPAYQEFCSLVEQLFGPASETPFNLEELQKFQQPDLF